MYKNIILAYDGSLESQQALLNCKDLSQWEHAKVHLLSVVPYKTISIGHEASHYSEQQNKIKKERCFDVLHQGVEQLKKAGKEATGELIQSDAVYEIVQYALNIDADLIILGYNQDQNLFERWWRGSIQKVFIDHSPCSVLFVITN